MFETAIRPSRELQAPCSGIFFSVPLCRCRPSTAENCRFGRCFQVSLAPSYACCEGDCDVAGIQSTTQAKYGDTASDEPCSAVFVNGACNPTHTKASFRAEDSTACSLRCVESFGLHRRLQKTPAGTVEHLSFVDSFPFKDRPTERTCGFRAASNRENG